jgi:hypothetical protein
MRTLALISALAVAVALSSCDGGSDPAPTHPSPLPDAASLIPAAPAPQPTPTPAPGATPSDPEPWPAIPGTGGGGVDGGVGGDAGSCGSPAPPPISRVRVSVHSSNGERMTLDSTPLVGPDVDYCRLIGFTDGRSFCPVRTEGNPERFACEAALVGRASDTGRIGPTWSVDGRPCDGYGDVASCENHSDNQFLAYAWGHGTFRACTAAGACGDLVVP